MTRWDGDSNECMYERCSMGGHANRVNYGVVEWVKRSTGRWFVHNERIGSEEFTIKVYMSEGPNRRGRPPGRWRDRVKKYICERGATRG